jgi:hypothetical protein
MVGSGGNSKSSKQADKANRKIENRKKLLEIIMLIKIDI